MEQYMSKKILFITYFFPPANEVASIRSQNICKYLLRNGWEVDVLTKNCESTISAEIQPVEGLKIIHIEDPVKDEFYKSKNIIFKIFRKIYQELFLDRGHHWCKRAFDRIDVQTTKYNIILATGGPFTLFELAKSLSARKGVPYALDYRDLWNGNPHLSSFLSRSNLEEKLINEASWIFTVSNSCKESLVVTFGCEKKISVLTNGFDPTELDSVCKGQFQKYFNIVYAGTFYPPKRVLDPVLNAISLLERVDKKRIKLNYYGPHSEIVEKCAKKYFVSENIALNGQVDRRQSLSAQKGADLVLVISTVDSKSSLAERGILTGKVFESIGLGRPILAICPQDSDLHQLIIDNYFGFTFSGDQVMAIAEFLMMSVNKEADLSLLSKKVNFSWPIIIQNMNNRLNKLIREMEKFS